MALPLEALSLTAVLQPLVEINDVVTQFKSLRASFRMIMPSLTRPEVEDHVQTIETHLNHAIAFYESLL